jgi:hypothetical protein
MKIKTMNTKRAPITGLMTTVAVRIVRRFFPRRPEIRIMRIKTAAIFASEGRSPPPGGADIFAIAPLVMKQFGHLPQPINVTCDGDEVVIRHPADGEHVLSYGIPPAGYN